MYALLRSDNHSLQVTTYTLVLELVGPEWRGVAATTLQMVWTGGEVEGGREADVFLLQVWSWWQSWPSMWSTGGTYSWPCMCQPWRPSSTSGELPYIFCFQVL